MSKTWYPVIDYEKCQECGSCVAMCRHGVYDTAKMPVPVVVNPTGCVEGCHGCGSKCPAGAISYVGDRGADNSGASGCSCDCGCGSC